MIENKTTSDCTIYAFVGTAILAISLVVAMYVGNDFHQSLFVESIIFVGRKTSSSPFGLQKVPDIHFYGELSL